MLAGHGILSLLGGDDCRSYNCFVLGATKQQILVNWWDIRRRNLLILDLVPIDVSEEPMLHDVFDIEA